ncbi:MAG: patatin-like phospholipase family protein [Rhizobiales bacterium]|nr:patatin-like phospholipase family protein [Hyphomicrobiales bacterium]
MSGGRSATDIHSLFSANTGNGDLVQARKLEDTIGLCLSGGGYRAMIYHAGALTRLNELGFLARLQEIASVSGGSITAGMLAVAWPRLRFDHNGIAQNFSQEVAEPLLRFSRIGVDLKAIAFGLIPGRSAADSVAASYDRHLFKGAGLQDIPDAPRFTFMATNLQTGSGWRFAKAYAADFRVGRIEAPSIALARVVAASSAFPPFLSPVRIEFPPGSVQATAGADLHRPPFTERAVLSDGGVYDNLGLERVWKRCRTVLVSNAGKTVPELGSPTGRWIGQTLRTLNLVQQQAENSRRRILFGMSNLGQREVAYWSINTSIDAYGTPDPLAVPSDAVRRAATIRTRLNKFSPAETDLLLAVGYAGADAALRSRGLAPNMPPAQLPAAKL